MDGFNTTLNQGGNGGGGGAAAKLAVSITYAALKALRDGGNLVPGTWYRITTSSFVPTMPATSMRTATLPITMVTPTSPHANSKHGN